MTRTAALVGKEWRDHRAAIAVFGAIVPLVSWCIQRWVFKFAEPAWTWEFMVPLCVGLAVAVVASDLFAMDLATSRMDGFAALPVRPRRHFGVRLAFLAGVAALLAAWTVVANAAIVGVWGKPGAVAALFGSFDPAIDGLAMCFAATSGVLVFSALGVGGFRGVLGGGLLALGAYAACVYALGVFVPQPAYWNPQPWRTPLTWSLAGALLLAAGWSGFCATRALASFRRRGLLVAAAILVGVLGAPAGAAAWKQYRQWVVSPYDPEILVQQGPSVSPDGRYVAVWAHRPTGGARSFVVRTADGALFDWPSRNEVVAGWTHDGLAWAGRMDHRPDAKDYGRFARPETGETVEKVTSLDDRLAEGLGPTPRWARWLRWNHEGIVSKNGEPVLTKWKLWSKESAKERIVVARSMPGPMPTEGEIVYVDAADRLVVANLDGGNPRVAFDAPGKKGIHGWTAGSPDGKYVLIYVDDAPVVLDIATWRVIAGPWPGCEAWWCRGANEVAHLALTNRKTQMLDRLVQVPGGREVAPDPALGVLGGYWSVAALPSGGFVARSGTNKVLLLDAEGKLMRRLFPPEE